MNIKKFQRKLSKVISSLIEAESLARELSKIDNGAVREDVELMHASIFLTRMEVAQISYDINSDLNQK